LPAARVAAQSGIAQSGPASPGLRRGGRGTGIAAPPAGVVKLWQDPDAPGPARPAAPPAPVPARILLGAIVEFQVSLIDAALPMFGGHVDRMLLFVMIARRTIRGESPAPVLALAQSLDLPFETARRQVAALIEAGSCERTGQGIRAADTAAVDALVRHLHDCIVRLWHDLGERGIAPSTPPRSVAYDWRLVTAVGFDLLFEYVRAVGPRYRDNTDMLLVAIVMCANYRPLFGDVALGRHYSGLADRPPEAVKPRIGVRQIVGLLGLSEATVRRRLATLRQSVLRVDRHGLRVCEHWFGDEAAHAVSAQYAFAVQRALTKLAVAGFPFAAPSGAYLSGRPPYVRL
jgi:DNA-binding Lrp family transcriptional regulator